MLEVTLQLCARRDYTEARQNLQRLDEFTDLDLKNKLLALRGLINLVLERWDEASLDIDASIDAKPGCFSFYLYKYLVLRLRGLKVEACQSLLRMRQMNWRSIVGLKNWERLPQAFMLGMSDLKPPPIDSAFVREMARNELDDLAGYVAKYNRHDFWHLLYKYERKIEIVSTAKILLCGSEEDIYRKLDMARSLVPGKSLKVANFTTAPYHSFGDNAEKVSARRFYIVKVEGRNIFKSDLEELLEKAGFAVLHFH